MNLPFHVMAKPIGPICNIDCRYCFYLEKTDLYPGTHAWRMRDDVLEQFVRQYIEQQDAPEVAFAWQGGEPTLLGVDFFRRVVELQARYAGGKVIGNALQTNGILLDDEWGEFLARHGFLVGLSVDGPRRVHDRYRVGKHGEPTFDKVMKGLAALKRHRVEFNTLTVVNRSNSQEPLEVYRFLKQIGSRFIQFIPLVERAPDLVPLMIGGRAHPHALAEPPDLDGSKNSSRVTEWSVESEQYGTFLCTIFDEWVRRDVGKTFVQLFDVALGQWMGVGSSLCVFAETCGAAVAVEHNGDVYSCDHYVYPRYKLGNLLNRGLGDLVTSPEQRAFGADKRDRLPAYCRRCEVRFACNGECPKHRFAVTPDGEPGLNYLCKGYKKFFSHVSPYMKRMADLIRAGQPAARIMSELRHREDRTALLSRGRVGRNDPCPCGSGVKFKRCCGKVGGPG